MAGLSFMEIEIDNENDSGNEIVGIIPEPSFSSTESSWVCRVDNVPYFSDSHYEDSDPGSDLESEEKVIPERPGHGPGLEYFESRIPEDYSIKYYFRDYVSRKLRLIPGPDPRSLTDKSSTEFWVGDDMSLFDDAVREFSKYGHGFFMDRTRPEEMPDSDPGQISIISDPEENDTGLFVYVKTRSPEETGYFVRLISECMSFADGLYMVLKKTTAEILDDLTTSLFESSSGKGQVIDLDLIVGHKNKLFYRTRNSPRIKKCSVLSPRILKRISESGQKYILAKRQANSGFWIVNL